MSNSLYEKEVKDEAVYGTPPPLGRNARCELCRHFIPVPGSADGLSNRVYGIVQPSFGCMNFEPLTVRTRSRDRLRKRYEQ